jgi:hypothetical protein
VINMFLFNFSFSAAVPLAVKSLYLHHCLMNNSLGGSTMSVNPNIIHSLIEKSVTVKQNPIMLNLLLLVTMQLFSCMISP